MSEVATTAAEIQALLDDVFDQAILFHAFTSYMRDYEVIAHAVADPATGIAPTTLSYRFRHCVEASVRSAVTPQVWQRSLDDALIDYATGVDRDGYVWGVKWQCIYPGATVVERSARAAAWSEAIGIDFHEVKIETNGHDIELLFHELVVAEVAAGYAPFRVE